MTTSLGSCFATCEQSMQTTSGKVSLFPLGVFVQSQKAAVNDFENRHRCRTRDAICIGQQLPNVGARLPLERHRLVRPVAQDCPSITSTFVNGVRNHARVQHIHLRGGPRNRARRGVVAPTTRTTSSCPSPAREAASNASYTTTARCPTQHRPPYGDALFVGGPAPCTPNTSGPNRGSWGCGPPRAPFDGKKRPA